MIDKKFFLGLALGYIASQGMRRNPGHDDEDRKSRIDEVTKAERRMKKGRRTIYKQFEHDMRDLEDYLKMDREGYVHRR